MTMAHSTLKLSALAAFTGLMVSGPALATGDGERGGAGCDAIAGQLGNSVYTGLERALKAVAPNQQANGGSGGHIWGAIVDPNGVVCALAFTGPDLRDQRLVARVASAQKANTAVLFNLPAGVGGRVDAFSSANLYAPTQPGGSLFGLQFSNPVDPAVAYGDNRPGGDETSQGADTNEVPPPYGTREEPLVGEYIGGISVFGGGLALYDANGNVVGGLGVSGDTSCADHNIAWWARNRRWAWTS